MKVARYEVPGNERERFRPVRDDRTIRILARTWRNWTIRNFDRAPGIRANCCAEGEGFDRPLAGRTCLSTLTQSGSCRILGFYQSVPAGRFSQIAFWPRAISVAAGGNSTNCFADDRWLT
jgi:hypothetical protein